MKTTKLSTVSGALASVLMLLAIATSRTFAGDGADAIDEAPTNSSCCGQTAVALQSCAARDHVLATPEPLLRTSEAAPRNARHTVTAFGFVLSGNRDGGATESLDRDPAAFSEIQPSPSLSRADAERQPRGLRLFSWSW